MEFGKSKSILESILTFPSYIVETYLNRQWTLEDVERADKFYNTHNAGNKPYPWPKDLFIKFIKENNGYFPIKVEALPDGTP